MRKITIILLSVLLANCGKDVTVDKALTNLTINPRNNVLADGQSVVSLSVTLPGKTSNDRRTVIFSTTSGAFVGGNNKFTAKAEYENGMLTAKATLKVSTKPTTVKVSVTPEFDSPSKEFILTDSFTTNLSVPAFISLQPSSFGISTNFLNEVMVTAYVKNKSQGWVSKGYKVLWEQFVGQSPAAGQFREKQEETADSSKVTTYYAAYAHPIGTPIQIRATLLENGQKTLICDSILLTINQ